MLHNLKEATDIEQSVGSERKRVLEETESVLVMRKHIYTGIFFMEPFMQADVQYNQQETLETHLK
jgi:hypothetical protein